MSKKKYKGTSKVAILIGIGRIRFSSEFIENNNLSSFDYVELFYNLSKRQLGFHFTNHMKKNYKLLKNGSNKSHLRYFKPYDNLYFDFNLELKDYTEYPVKKARRMKKEFYIIQLFDN